MTPNSSPGILLTKVNLFAWNDFTIAFRFGVGILSL